MGEVSKVIDKINDAITKAIKEYGNNDVFKDDITAIEVTDKFKDNITGTTWLKKNEKAILEVIIPDVKKKVTDTNLITILASIESVKLVINRIPKTQADFLAFFQVKTAAAEPAASPPAPAPANLFKNYNAPGKTASALPNEDIAMSLLKKLLYDTILVLLKEYSTTIVKEIRPAAASGGGSGGSSKKDKKQKGGFIDLDYDTQKMYNAQGLITELASLNAPSGNMNLNQPDPFSASGPSAGAAFESLPPNMIAGLTPNFSGGAKKKKNLKH
jgi:hypothetical protein